MTDTKNPPGHELLGAGIASAAYRSAWRDLVLAARRASLPGGPLDGWVFHGTSLEDAESMAASGMDANALPVRPPEGGPACWAEGTCWGTAWIAAYYCDDLVEDRGDPDLSLALLAVRVDDLADLGDLVPDEQSLDCPIESRLGRPAEAILGDWDASARDWRASLDLVGSFACLAPVPADRLRVVATMGDLADLVRDAAAPSPPHP